MEVKEKNKKLELLWIDKESGQRFPAGAAFYHEDKEAAMQMLHDQTVAESLRMINTFKEFSTTQEENSIRIGIDSRNASPKGAMRMQAETSAEILRSLSQLIRLNTQMLKLQSEQFGMQNKLGKESVANFQKANDDLGRSFSGMNPTMDLIKF